MPDRVDNDHSHDRAKALSELQQLLLDTPDITGFLDELARYAADTIGCGLSVLRDHHGPRRWPADRGQQRRPRPHAGEVGFEHGGVGAGPYDRAATLVSRWMFTAMTESIAGR